MTTAITGRVTRLGNPVPGAYVRLLDVTGELAHEVVTSADGDFTFTAEEGPWTLRALSPAGSAGAQVRALPGGSPLTELAISA